MKRDMDLMREILLAIERSDKSPLGWIDLDIPGRSLQDVSYNVMLLGEAGSIEVQNLCGMGRTAMTTDRSGSHGKDMNTSMRSMIP